MGPNGTLNGSIFTFSAASEISFSKLLCALFDVVLGLESENLQNDDATLCHSVLQYLLLFYSTTELIIDPLSFIDTILFYLFFHVFYGEH